VVLAHVPHADDAYANFIHVVLIPKIIPDSFLKDYRPVRFERASRISRFHFLNDPNNLPNREIESGFHQKSILCSKTQGNEEEIDLNRTQGRSFVKKAQQKRCFNGKNTPLNTIDVTECYAKVMQWLAYTDNMENRIGSWPIPMEKESAILRAPGRPTKTKPKNFSMRQQKRSGYGKRVTSLNSALAQL
jgi:hypothetical protein